MKLIFKKQVVIDYPSGSALEFENDVFYLIGDDTHFIQCLDKDLSPCQTISLFDYPETRIPKALKPDLECASIIDHQLFIFGSGSKAPRDIMFQLNLQDQRLTRVDSPVFYDFLREKFPESALNVEGFTSCRDRLLIFNRANNSMSNTLFITDKNVLDNRAPVDIKSMALNLGTLNNVVLGISGACYDEESDVLILTASAEDTDNAYDDGEVLGSVLAVITNAYKKLAHPERELEVDEIIELNLVGSVFHKQKIESVCLRQKTANNYRLVLVADNDDGKSVLFEADLFL